MANSLAVQLVQCKLEAFETSEILTVITSKGKEASFLLPTYSTQLILIYIAKRT